MPKERQGFDKLSLNGLLGAPRGSADWGHKGETTPKSVRAELAEALLFPFNRRMPFWAYMLHCRGGAFYVGHTDDLDRRMAEHQSGAIPGFTRDHLPVTLVWSEQFSTRIEALEAERRIKGWSRAKKLALIRGDFGEISRLARSKLTEE